MRETVPLITAQSKHYALTLPIKNTRHLRRQKNRFIHFAIITNQIIYLIVGKADGNTFYNSVKSTNCQHLIFDMSNNLQFNFQARIKLGILSIILLETNIKRRCVCRAVSRNLRA